MKNILIFFLFCTATLVAAQQDIIKKKKLAGSEIWIWEPENWNQKVFFIAHGLVPDGFPLSAEFSSELPFYQQLNKEGWIIASTSYRRNGMIIYDAMEDLFALQDDIEKVYGEIELSILQGSSMGGMIGTLIAEQTQTKFDGVLNMGAALGIKMAEREIALNYTPKIPVLFLSNAPEAELPRQYVERASKKNENAAFWLIDRSGHVNINQQEQRKAFEALLEFIETGKIKRNLDATIPLNPESTVVWDEDGLQTKIISIEPLYGNVIVDIVLSDLQKLDISRGEYFQIQHKYKTFKVMLGSNYGDVPSKKWVAFITGDGHYKISCNYCQAEKKLGAKIGDRITIRNL